MLKGLKKKLKVLFVDKMTNDQKREIARVVDETLATSAHHYDQLEKKIEALRESYGPFVLIQFFRSQFTLVLDEEQACEMWGLCNKHHQTISRDHAIDYRASFLDCFLNQTTLMAEPIVMEKTAKEHLQKVSLTDELTGLYNVRYLNQALQREIGRSRRKHIASSLIFLDIDHFKKLNDKYGHLTGDMVLREIGKVISLTVRTSDLPCRYGGEEFAVLLPETDREGALLLADRIRERIESLVFYGVKEKVTISGGVACFPQDAASEKDLLHAADQALYKAKSLGRNRVEAFARIGDKRKRSRRAKRIPGLLSSEQVHGKPCFTKNISHQGLLVETTSPVSPGSTLKLQLKNDRLPRAIECVGHVVHVNNVQDLGTFELGIHIVHMDAQDEALYKKFLTD